MVSHMLCHALDLRRVEGRSTSTFDDGYGGLMRRVIGFFIGIMFIVASVSVDTFVIQNYESTSDLLWAFFFSIPGPLIIFFS